MADSLVQPFRRNLTVDPVIIPVGVTAAAVPVAAMTTKGVTSFKMHNPNPFWVWYRGWTGAASDMPTIREKGHYLAPGATDLCRTQMPNFIAAVAEDEPGFPIYDANNGGSFLYAGMRTRLVMIYGSGA